MSSDSFHERGQAMEDLFFKNVDEKLLAKMRTELKTKQDKESLAAATGINDVTVLDALLKSNISAETVVALSFIPLVAVAWSDGVLETGERSAIEKAVTEAGLDQNSAAFALVQHWLAKKPASDLVATWKTYMQLLKTRMDHAAFGQMRSNVLDRSAMIAKAAGGFLGLGSKISDSEQKVLDDLRDSM